MTKTCTHCQTSFEITDDDRAYYDKISPVFNGKKYQIPPPTLCGDCREQRRTALRVERCLYNRPCDLCQKDIISIYSPDKSNPVYCQKCWWSDNWDPRKYARDFDFTRPFFEQFQEFRRAVPELAIQNDNGVASENCEYCQDFAYGKNCYLVVGSWYDRDCMYCTNCSYVVEAVDCEEVNTESELIYESNNCHRLYRCSYLQYCENCSNCDFGYDLKGCTDCFACYGLRQKKFHIFNKPYTEEEYKKKMAAFQRGSFTELEKMKKIWQDWNIKFPRKNMYLIHCENSSGNFLFHCKDTFGFSLDDAQGCKFFYRGDAPQFCYDVHQSGRCKWCYEDMTPDDSYLTHFSTWCWKDKNLLYSHNCHSSEHLFACSGLKHGKYSIFNKQYTQEEYEKLVPKIIQHMTQRGEWGEAFPITISPFGYNETLANELYPLTEEQARAQNYPWKKDDGKKAQPAGYILPDDVKDVADEILTSLLVCTDCGKNYKLIPLELAFYRKMNLPIPRKCSRCRHFDRMRFVSPLRLWQRQCAKCKKDIQAAYAPEQKEIVYCETCYAQQMPD